MFGSAFGPPTRRLMEWIYEEGMCDAATRDKDWIRYALLLLGGEEPFSELERVQEVIACFTVTRTKAELFDEAQRRGVILAPVATIADVRSDPHLAARDFWVPASPGDDAVSYPGPFAKFSASPLTYRRRAPHLGEHDAEVRREWLVDHPRRIERSAAPNAAPTRDPRRPLEGIKVLDLSRVYVGPTSTRILADFGATVVKVESSRYVDAGRTQHPMKDGEDGAERSGLFHTANAGKLGLALDVSKPEARAVLKRLIAWADVLVEAFTPHVMRSWGLGYDDVRSLNPSIIYVSSCLCGQWGPHSNVAGYGNLGAAMAGFDALVGWKDREPAGTSGAYTDSTTPAFITSAVLAALEHRERTGEGQHVDLAHVEASLHFLTPVLLEYQVNGRSPVPDGNRDPGMAPHGMFPCAGPDRWIAIAVQDDGQWRGLCVAMGRPDLAADQRYASLQGRKCHEDELERELARWTATQAAERLQDALIAHGVAAHVGATIDDVWTDPQLRHRGYYVPVQHQNLGQVVVESSRVLLSRTPSEIRAPGPTYGQDAHRVLSEILGLSEAEIADLAGSGVLE
jgi:crotonobetainyl-CoA:carnitine CoA-transferase CaiB-like acyl-CoA transferase